MSLPINDILKPHHLDIILAYKELMSLRLVRLKLGYKDKSYVYQVIKRYAPEIMRPPYVHFSWENPNRNRFKKGYKNAT